MGLLVGPWPLLLGLSLSGLVSGVLAGLLGIGGGSIIVPILSYAFEAMGFGGNVAQHVAVASSLAIIIPTGAALTAPVGAALAHRMPPMTLKYLFAVYLALIGLGMIWKAISG